MNCNFVDLKWKKTKFLCVCLPAKPLSDNIVPRHSQSLEVFEISPSIAEKVCTMVIILVVMPALMITQANKTRSNSTETANSTVKE